MNCNQECTWFTYYILPTTVSPASVVSYVLPWVIAVFSCCLPWKLPVHGNNWEKLLISLHFLKAWLIFITMEPPGLCRLPLSLCWEKVRWNLSISIEDTRGAEAHLKSRNWWMLTKVLRMALQPSPSAVWFLCMFVCSEDDQSRSWWKPASVLDLPTLT